MHFKLIVAFVDDEKTEAVMHAAELQPGAVGALVDAVERRAAIGVGLKDVRIEAFADDLRGHRVGVEFEVAPHTSEGAEG